MFVALTDFPANPYLIPSKPENANGITAFIETREKEILEKMLGLLFYRLMVDGINALPAEWVTTTNYSIGNQVVYGSEIYEAASSGSGNTPGVSGQWVLHPENKWLKLKKGDVYQFDGRENVWVGMKECLLTYIHAMYLSDYNTSITATGVVKHVSENSEAADPSKRIVEGYNKFSKYVGSFHCHYDSLIGYLYANRLLFDDDLTAKGYASFWEYVCYKFVWPDYMNTHGL